MDSDIIPYVAACQVPRYGVATLAFAKHGQGIPQFGWIGHGPVELQLIVCDLALRSLSLMLIE